MSSAPSFASTPRVAAGLLTTADTNYTAPSTAPVTIFTGAATVGSKIEEVVIQGVATTVAGVVNLFVYDGTTYHLVDQVLVTAVTSSTTAVAFRARRQYQNLLLPSSSHSLRATTTVAQTGIKVIAFGADF